jgi:hypothetical protein
MGIEMGMEISTCKIANRRIVRDRRTVKAFEMREQFRSL